MKEQQDVMIRRTEDVPAMDVDRASRTTMQVLLGSEQGMPNYYTRLFTMEPGGHIPSHRHATIEHQQVVLEGELVLIKDGGEEVVVRQGDVVYLPAKKYHGYQNRGTGPVKLLCIVPATAEYSTEWLETS